MWHWYKGRQTNSLETNPHIWHIGHSSAVGEGQSFQEMVLGQLDRILWEKCILIPLIASCSCCKKITRNLWLKPIELYTFTVLEVRSSESVSPGQNQGVSRANTLEAVRENVICLFPSLELRALLVSWLHQSSHKASNFCYRR